MITTPALSASPVVPSRAAASTTHATAAAPKAATPTPTALTPIPAIQGTDDTSPLAGTAVSTTGVITSVARVKGAFDSVPQQVIFVQDPQGDGDVHSSDAIAVRTTTPFTGKIGSLVTVSGNVKEMDGMTSIVDATISAQQAVKGARRAAKAEITPVELKLPSNAGDAAQWYESHEGMMGALTGGLVMTPTTSYGTFTAVNEATHGVRKDYDGENAGQHVDISSDGGVRLRMATGDRFDHIFGPIDQSRGSFRLLASSKDVSIQPGPKAPAMWGDIDGDGTITPADITAIKAREDGAATGPLDAGDLDGNGTISPADTKLASARMKRNTGVPTFTVANLNTENFFDTVDNPKKRDTIPSAAEYAQKLGTLAKLISGDMKSPSLIGLEEVENETVLKDLVARPELKDAGYQYQILQGPDLRGINTAILYRPGQGVAVTNVRQEQGTTKLKSVDKGADKALFARPPLVADVTVTPTDGGAASEFTVMVNHFMSKYAPTGKPTDPWRVEQAQFVRDLAKKLRTEDPKRGVMLLGDLNDNDSSAAIKLLVDKSTSPFVGVGQTFVPKGERYTYQYRGSSESIDHIMVTPDLADLLQQAQVHHVNADVAAFDDTGDAGAGVAAGAPRATDHDILSAAFAFPAAKK